MLKAFKAAFKTFDVGLTTKATKAEKNYAKMLGGNNIPSMKDMQELKTGLLEVAGLTLEYTKQVKLMKKMVVFAQSGQALGLIEAQLGKIKTEIDSVLNTIG